MELVNSIKLGLAIDAKLKQSLLALESGTIIKRLLQSVTNEGQFTVVEWSVLGKYLEVFGNGKRGKGDT